VKHSTDPVLPSTTRCAAPGDVVPLETVKAGSWADIDAARMPSRRGSEYASEIKRRRGGCSAEAG